MLNAFVPTYYRQTADQSLATTTFTNHNLWTGLTFNANELWHVEMVMVHTAADVADDIKVRLESTGTVTIDGYRAILSESLVSASSAGTNTALDTTVNWQGRLLTDSVSGGSTLSTTSFAVWRETFVLNGGVSGGTWGVEWAQSSATSGNTTVKAGSYLIMHRLS